METEDDVDLHGPYVGLELFEDVKTTQTEGVVVDGDVPLH
jgi:hypothetical protein